jgi:hypothetical protein
VCVLMLQLAHFNKIKSTEPEKLEELLSGKQKENVGATEALQKAADELTEFNTQNPVVEQQQEMEEDEEDEEDLGDDSQ